ncbi:MAG: DUF4345 family protein [Anaerolineaceae bacterium]|nr:DUF4345 family protein [Anaerolineaceae bacterium]
MGILKIIAAVVTILIGVLSLLLPTQIKGFTGLDVAGNPRGITEVRAILGAFFIGLGLAPLIWRSQSESMYLMLGFTYLVVAGVRVISMFLDKSVMQSNIISAVSEIILGVILVLPS